VAVDASLLRGRGLVGIDLPLRAFRGAAAAACARRRRPTMIMYGVDNIRDLFGTKARIAAAVLAVQPPTAGCAAAAPEDDT
jgi:hypothetical protein